MGNRIPRALEEPKAALRDFTIMLTLQDELKTEADYAAMPDDGEQYELIAGEIILVPPPTTFHQDILTFLMGELYPIVRSR